MAYAVLDENSYYARWCDQRNRKCSEVWPKDCPEIKRETLYEEAVKAYDKKLRTGIEEYYAWCKRNGKERDTSELVEYTRKFAGTEPKLEDF
jgi:hypothetical protein